jgi:hypothetical protein
MAYVLRQLSTFFGPGSLPACCGSGAPEVAAVTAMERAAMTIHP